MVTSGHLEKSRIAEVESRLEQAERRALTASRLTYQQSVWHHEAWEWALAVDARRQQVEEHLEQAVQALRRLNNFDVGREGREAEKEYREARVEARRVLAELGAVGEPPDKTLCPVCGQPMVPHGIYAGLWCQEHGEPPERSET